MSDDFGAYEIELPQEFDFNKFKESVKGDNEKFWLVCLEEDNDFYRFTGIFIDSNKRWRGIHLDIDNDKDSKTAFTPTRDKKLVWEIAHELGASIVYKDGILQMPEEDNIPHLSYWTDIRIELYCHVNLEYFSKCDKYCYELINHNINAENWEDNWKKVDNPRFDPSCIPNPWPEGCTQELGIDCLECEYVGYCEYDEELEEE